MSAVSPRVVLKYNAVSIDVLERPALVIPIRIPRRDLSKARRDEPRTTPLPVCTLRDVEHQKVIAGRRLPNPDTALAGELEVIRRTRMAQDDAVEPAVVHELAEDREAKAVRIHLGDGREI